MLRQIVLFIAALAALPAFALGRLPETSIGKIVTLPATNAEACNQHYRGQPVRLLVQGIDTGLRSVGCDDKLGVSFRVERPPAGVGLDAAALSAAWELMLGRPWEDSHRDFVRTLEYQMRQAQRVDDKETDFVVGGGRFDLRLFTSGIGFAGVALVLATWAGLGVLVVRSAIVRDPGPVPMAPLSERSFSLARLQMAWWFAIITGTYIFLWVITRETPTIGGQALGLMGVAGLTAISSFGVDTNNPGVPPRQHRTFILDLLSENDGVTLHRFQMLAMTVILGVIFVMHVGSHLSMPEFDANTLGLLGISAGTYVGFKIPEKRQLAAAAGVSPTGERLAPAADDPKAGYSPSPDLPTR
jgi:hypothetical protein